MSMDTSRILVLGIGNILWADEGFGVRVVEELHRRYAFPENVQLMDGGTQGLYLVQHVQDCDQLLVIDAVDYGRRPGDIVIARGDEVPKFTGAKKMSLHQTGFQEVLSAADLMGDSPEAQTLIGVQAALLDDWCGSLSDPVRACIDPVIDFVLAELRDWGVLAIRRAEPLPEDAGLLQYGLDLQGYEARPSVPGEA
ncbi:HyaD/HybD family hydrogenase maturation endopeptidase [Magnetospira thiophila]